MKVALVQTSLHWQDRQKNLQKFEKMLKGAEHASLYVLPEMFSTGFTMQPEQHAEDHPGPSLHFLMQAANKKGADICGSVSVRDREHFYNRLYYVKPGDTLSHYDKRHLFRMGDEHEHYSPGQSKEIIHAQGFRICPLVCYDLRFPVWSRNRFSKQNGTYEYDILIYVANWPAVRSFAWKQLLIARAIENQCYVIGVNRIGRDGNDTDHCGDSMVIGPKGETLLNLQNNDGVASTELNLEELHDFRRKFPAGLDGDDFTLSF